MIPLETHRATFEKLAVDSDDADKETWQEVDGLVGIGVSIQPVSADTSEVATGVFAGKHSLFAPTTCSGVLKGYRVTISGAYEGELNRQFFIEEVSDWNYGPLPHMEMILNDIQD